jgi:hypothetical protein
MENKTYYLGYNRYDGKVIVYSNAADATRSGSWWREVTSYNLETAKAKFLEDYIEAHHEIE